MENNPRENSAKKYSNSTRASSNYTMGTDLTSITRFISGSDTTILDMDEDSGSDDEGKLKKANLTGFVRDQSTCWHTTLPVPESATSNVLNELSGNNSNSNRSNAMDNSDFRKKYELISKHTETSTSQKMMVEIDRPNMTTFSVSPNKVPTF